MVACLNLRPEALLRRGAPGKNLEDQRLGILGLVAGGVAHDLQNILQIVSGSLELLSFEIEPGSKACRRLTNAQHGVALGAKVTSRILDYCRADPPEMDIVDFADMKTARLLRSLIVDAVGEGISVEFEVQPGAWPVRLCLNQLKTALVNLAVNARDAMTGIGVIRAVVSNFPDESGNGADLVVLAFEDNGLGISKDALTQIFEPFYTTKEHGRGTGLGLALVRQFADTSLAALEVQSECGQGTRFSFAFPRFP